MLEVSLSNSNTAEKKSIYGTKEWAPKNINIIIGCSHDCRYCYAKHMAVTRFKRVSNWKNEVVNMEKVNKKYKKVIPHDGYAYDFMFPSSHDITPANIEPCITALKNILQSGNRVLIVSKPHLDCIIRLIHELAPWKANICFRFTITAMDNKILQYWEPNAPLFEERMDSLKAAFKAGFNTSISIEPALDIPNIRHLVEALTPYVNESIWVGVMKDPNQRVTKETIEDIKAIDAIIRNQTEDRIVDMYKSLREYRLLKFKDVTFQLLQRVKVL